MAAGEIVPPILSIRDLVLQSETRVDEFFSDYVYTARCETAGDRLHSVTAVAQSTSPHTQVIEGSLRCIDVPVGGSVESVDTFTLRHDRRELFDLDALEWVAVGFGPEELVSETRIDATRFRYVYRLVWSNNSSDEATVVGMVRSLSPSTVIDEGILQAVLPPTSSLITGGTFSVVHDRTVPFDPTDLAWTLGFGAPPEFALGVTRTLDGLGHPLGRVTIDERGPQGLRVRESEADSGIATLAQERGAFRWRFSTADHLPVWRERTLEIGETALVESPWLPLRSADSTTVTVLNGGIVGEPEGGAQVRFVGGDFTENSEARLTEVGPQSLPMLLPSGWSPLNAFWLELDRAPREPGEGELRPIGPIAEGENAAFVRLDEQRLEWVVLEIVTGDGGDLFAVSVPGSGAYALVVADGAPTAPPPAVVGARLASVGIAFPNPGGLSAVARATPSVAALSSDPDAMTARAEVIVSHAEALPSGFVLRGEVDEVYRLLDGRELVEPGYRTFFVGYQRPGDANPSTLHASFPLRPQRVLEIAGLEEAAVHVEIVPVSDFEGGLFDASGGQIASQGIIVSAPAGAFDGTRAAELRTLDASRFADLAPGATLVSAFELLVDGLAPGARLLTDFGLQTPNADFVLARVLTTKGIQGLEPRERFVSDAAGRLSSVEPTQGERLPGLTGSGRYVLVRVEEPQGLVRGIARNQAGMATAGLLVRLTGLPWLTLSDGSGIYRLVAPAGDVEVVVIDTASGDSAVGLATLSDASAIAEVDVSVVPSGPRVVSVDPADGAVGIDPVTPIRVTLSEPAAAGSIGPDALVLRDSSGNVVASSLSLSLDRRVLTLLPIEPLAYAESHGLEVSAAITDAGGLPLEGERFFGFRTEAAPTRGASAQLISWEPGAQTAECDGVPGFDLANPSISCVHGTAGTADPEVPVILVNQTSGATATVLSRPDGSFESFIDAEVDDFLSAVFVNANGTRIEIPLSRQLFDDGGVALFEGGGILEAESDGGPVEVIVEPGAIPNKTKFNLDVVGALELLDLIQNTQPDGGKVAGGFRLSVEGDELKEPPDIRFPVSAEALGLPAEMDPSEASYALAVPTEIEGETAYQIVDKMEFEDDALVSRSYPFLLLSLVLRNSASAVLFTPVVLAQGPSVNIAGKTRVRDPANPALDRPIGGALVALANDVIIQSGRRGRLSPGALFTNSDSNGFYAMRFPVNKFEGGGVAVTAIHPAFPGQRARDVVVLQSLIEEFLASFVERVDVYFQINAGGSGPDKSAPVISPSLSPSLPATDVPATLRVLASDDKTRPTIQVDKKEIVSLVPTATVALDDCTLGQPTDEDVGTLGKRQLVEITCDVPVLLIVEIKATDGAGNQAVVERKLVFGGIPPVAENPPASDENDEVGPSVALSWPTEGAVGVAPGDPIRLRFDSALDAAAIEDLSWVALSPDVGDPYVRLGADQTELTLYFPRMQPETSYALTISSTLQDLSGNPFDQDPTTPDTDDDFVLNFTTAPIPSGDLPGMEAGGGAVTYGAHAFAIERAGPLDGALVAFDLSDPENPVRVGELSVPGYPRDLALIGRYSFQLPDGSVSDQATNPETATLVAVAGGYVGASGFDLVGGDSGFQYLWVIDVSNPANPRRIASTVVTLSSNTVVPKLEWDPPFLVYLESQADAQGIRYVNLQRFLYGMNLPESDFPRLPDVYTEGEDKNGDGDYVDADEKLPLPGRVRELELYAGFDSLRSVAVTESTQRILDFSATRAGNRLAVALSAGEEIVTTGPPQPLDPQYRTMRFGNLQLPADLASLDLPVRPKRVFGLGPLLVDVAGNKEVQELVMVTLPPDPNASSGGGSGGTGGGSSAQTEPPNTVILIDITDPLAPVERATFDIPASSGIVQSIQVEDGLLAIATTNDVYLFDPSRLADPAPSQTAAAEMHPAFVGVVPGAGSGARTFGASSSGLRLVSLGGRNRVLQTAPRLRFVSFPEDDPIHPEDLVDQPYEDLEAKLARATPADSLRPARFRDLAGSTSTLEPPSPEYHYYVLVEAPGGDLNKNDTIDLALESLNRSGHPNRSRGFLFPPVLVGSAKAHNDILMTPRADDPDAEPLEAWRLSSDPSSPYYNVYLSQPFALVYEEMSKQEMTDLDNTLDRAYLWSGHFTRASIDPDMEAEVAIGAFASQVDGEALAILPGPHALARSLPGDYIQGPNPPPLRGAVASVDMMGSVAVHNGEFQAGMTDMLLQGRRMHIQFKRHIAAQGLFDGPFGRGWDFNYNQRLVEVRPDLVLPGEKIPLVERKDDDGHEVARSGDLVWYTGAGRSVVFELYQPQSSGGTSAPTVPVEYSGDELIADLGWDSAADRFYLPPKGVFRLLVHFPDGQYAMLDAEGLQYWFDADGRLARIYDKHDINSIHLSYNRRGELIRIQGDNHAYLDIGYYRRQTDPLFRSNIDESATQDWAQGKIHRLLDHTGRDVLFFYSDDGILEKREGPEITQAGPDGFTGRRETLFRTSDSANPAKTAMSIVGIDRGSANGAAFLGAPKVGTQSRDQVDEAELPTGTISFSLSHQNTAADLAQGSGATTVTAPNGDATKYELDEWGRAKAVELIGAAGSKTQFEYNEDGLVTKITYPRGNSIEYAYDETADSPRERGNLIQIKKVPSGAGGATFTATATYDGRYNLPTEKTDFNGTTYKHTLSTDGEEVTKVEISGVARAVEEFQYDGYGQLEKHTRLGGIVREYAHDGTTGFVTSETDGGFETRYVYDGDSGDLGLPTTITDPNGTDATLVYDEEFRLVSRKMDGFEVEYSYDEAGDEIKTTTKVASNTDLVETRVFDELGFMEEYTQESVEVDGQAKNLTTRYEPDGDQRIGKIIFPDGDEHLLGYDDEGHLESYAIGGFAQIRKYDENGNVTEISEGDAKTSLSYDGHDRLEEVVYPNGLKHVYTLDENGTLLGMKAVGGSGATLWEGTYEVDPLNRYTKVELKSGQGTSPTTYDYDATQKKLTITDANGEVSELRYDDAGRLEQVVNPDETTRYTRDANGNVTKLEVVSGGRTFAHSFEYNDRDQATRISDEEGNSIELTVGVGGRVDSRKDRDGYTTTYTYTRLGEFASITSPEGVKISFEYDEDRELASMKDAVGNEVKLDYDSEGHLASVTQADGSRSTYSDFDARGCPQSISLPGGVSVTLTYDLDCQLLTRRISSGGAQHDESYTYDALGRTLNVTHPRASTSYDYDPLGFMKQVDYAQNGLTHQMTQAADAAGFRTAVTYPSGLDVSNGRDGTGRLETLTPSSGDQVVSSTSYLGEELMTDRVLGTNAVRTRVDYDDRRRPRSIRYEKASDGSLLAEVRHTYDKRGQLTARQSVHRNGRLDFFEYDRDRRLTRVDHDARPAVSGELQRALQGFGPTEAGSWEPGHYARTMSYSNTDAITGADLVNPDDLDVPPFASSYGGWNALLATTTIDGRSRNPDVTGNIQQARLYVYPPDPAAAAPSAVGATLDYNLLGQLVTVDRNDGCRIEYVYGTHGLVIRRTVSGAPPACEPSDRDFVWDGGNLVEERDLGTGQVVARYYYGDGGDELLAADLDDGAGGLDRFYLLTDASRSVIAVADASGDVVERIRYDAWGAPRLEKRDVAPPRIARIRREGSDLLVEFSESILPPLQTTGGTGLLGSLRTLEGLFEIQTASDPIGGSARFEEGHADAAFGTLIRFTPDSPLPSLFTLQVAGGRVADEWGNGNPAESLSLSSSGPVGTPLYMGPGIGSTAAENLLRSGVGSPFLFQGQYFDYDTGLVYMRARFYEPATGLFLQRDPFGMEDSVNAYAGLANDPVNLRDPTGGATICSALGGRDCDVIGQEWKEAARQYRSGDGASDLAVSMALAFFGSVLDLGTGTAQGLELAGTPRKGPVGMMDLARAASLIAQDIEIAGGVLGAGMGLGTRFRDASAEPVAFFEHQLPIKVKQYSRSTYQSVRDIARQRLFGWSASDVLKTSYGYDALEAAAFIRIVHTENLVMSTRQGNNLAKLELRQAAIGAGRPQKPFNVKAKTGSDALVTDKVGRTFTGDIDVFDIAYTRGKGIPLSNSLLRKISRQINDEYIRISGRSSKPIQHMPQMQAISGFGGVGAGFQQGRWGSFGVTGNLDFKTLEKIGHPGHTVTIRKTASGNVVAHRTPGWMVDGQIRRAHNRFRSQMGDLKTGPCEGAPCAQGLPSSWFRWKWTD
jgi:RHS repeat-associated protein